MASLTLAAAAFQLEPDIPGGPGPAYPPTVGLLDEESEPEAAEALDVSMGTVKSRLSRARAAVRDALMAHRELLPDKFRQGRQE